jgi:pyruvate formate lyase activating enzyme
MGECLICHTRSPKISGSLGVCLDCIRNRPSEALTITSRVHGDTRRRFGLPPCPPRDPDGLECKICANSCSLGVGRTGFCGLVKNIDGRLVRFGGTPDKGILEWYYDRPKIPYQTVVGFFLAPPMVSRRLQAAPPSAASASSRRGRASPHP